MSATEKNDAEARREAFKKDIAKLFKKHGIKKLRTVGPKTKTAAAAADTAECPDPCPNPQFVTMLDEFGNEIVVCICS